MIKFADIECVNG